jgi:nucleoside-diphosphate-sugar epimerase
VDRYGGYDVNLLHYEDAAALATAVLSGDGAPAASPLGWRARAFIGADGAPVTFQAMCDAAVDSGAYPGAAKVNFTAAAPTGGRGLGKRLDPAGTRAALGWAPSHASFVQFVEGGGQDAYTRDERLRGGAAHQG